MKNFFENISEENKKYFYWFALALSSFIIVNLIFNPFGILTFLGTGILFSIKVGLYEIFSISLFKNNLIYSLLSIIFYPIVFYILYNLSIKKIHSIYFLLFIIFILLSISPLIFTFITFYLCRNGGDMGCLWKFVTLSVFFIEVLFTILFYYLSEKLK
jgi:hypothetical protein